MPVIAIATTKGGSGKTTLTACLAAHWTAAGASVICLDTDPNRNLSPRLGAAGIHCHEVPEEGIFHAATEAAGSVDIVLIDVAGALTRGLLYATSAADLVLIPCRPDRNDVVEAVRTQEVIRQAEAMTRRAIPHAAVLTQVNARAVVTAETRAQLAALRVPELSVSVPLRTAYQAASYTGAPLSDPAVREDMAALADAIDRMLEAADVEG